MQEDNIMNGKLKLVLNKDEVVDLNNGTYYFNGKIFQSTGYTPEVAGDHGLVPDHIAGATKKYGKVMYLIIWKNTVDGTADLLDADEVYNKYPQIAIKYFEECSIFIPLNKY